MNSLNHNNAQRPLQTALGEAVNGYFQQHDLAKTGDTALYRKAVIILFMHIVSYACFFILSEPYTWLAWTFHGFTTALIGFNIMHDGAHGSFSKNKSLNSIAAHTFNVIGSNAFYWKQKHNLNHHPYTNVAAADEDIEAFGLLRMSPDKPRYWFHRWQHIYVWILYPLTSLFWFFVLDFLAYFNQKIAEQEFSQKYQIKDSAIFWVSKAFYITLYLIVPSLFLGWETVLIGFLCLHAVMGFLFAVVFQLAHVVDKTEFPQPDEHGNLPYEWAAHQLATTADFAPSNKFTTWCVGGLNFQVEHHLFPRISHTHYPKLHAIVRKVCSEHGIQHREYSTVKEAILGHIRHLKNMGCAESLQVAQA
ncbi:MAG: linoleoyl-CoA desaturase [Oleispira sp.]|jgi:linoleoyl-CoA desaturase